MNIFGIVLGILVAAAVVYGAGELLITRTATRKQVAAQAAQREADLRATNERAREDERARWRRNPLDALRALHTRWGPRFSANAQQVSDTQHRQERATTQLGEYLADYPQHVLPSRSRIITIGMLIAAWAVAFVVQSILDFEIFLALWGNWFFAVLSAMGTSVALAAASVGLAYIRMHGESRERLRPRASRAALVGISSLFIVILTLLVLWAPQRAFIEFGGRIRDAQQQVAVLNGDGDTAAAAVVQADLDVLNTQQQQASDLSQALILIAVVCEFGCGLVLPQGLEIYLALRARKRRETAEDESRTALAVQRQDAVLFTKEASQSLVDAGLTQEELDRFQTALPGTTARTALAGPVTPEPQVPPRETAEDPADPRIGRSSYPPRGASALIPATDPTLSDSDAALFDQS